MKGTWIRKPSAAAVVVFVHGLFSDGNGCWRHPDGAFWPELLRDQPGLDPVGIYLFDYQTTLTSANYSPTDAVSALRQRLKLDGLLDLEHLFFVCHSLGGIIVRKLLVDFQYEFTRHKLGLFLVASPSHGSAYANYLSPFSWFFNHSQAKALRFGEDNHWLNDLHRAFLNLKEAQRLTLVGQELVEDRPLRLKKAWFLKKVVQPFSAACYFKDFYKVPGSDHSSIAKPENQKANQHELLVQFLNEHLKRWSQNPGPHQEKGGVDQDQRPEPTRTGAITTQAVTQSVVNSGVIHGDVTINIQPIPTKPEVPIPLPGPDELPERGDLPGFSRMEHRPNPAFVGRHRDLLDLHASLNRQNKAVITPLAAATGMGGIGKTQLAVEFAYRYGRFYPGGVLWLDFGDPEQVPAELVSCGVKMGLFEPDDPRSQEVKLERVQQAWSHPGPKRLLIFDNCESEDLLDRWAPRSGPNQVLVTSRKQHWSPALGLQQCPLGLLARKESIELLRGLYPVLTEEQANAIAAELGDLPLALYLAGSYLAYYKEDPLTYLRELPQQPLQHASMKGSQHGYQPTKHDTHVGRTFALSFNRLDPQDPIDSWARTLLLHAAQFAPGESILEQHLLDTVNADPRARKQALVRLLELGLIQQKEPSLTLHRLLQFFCQEAFPAEEQSAAQNYVASVIVNLADEVNHSGQPSRMAPLLSHLRYHSERMFSQNTALTVDLTLTIGSHLDTVSALREAERFSRRALAVSEKVHGPDHETTATCLSNLAHLLRATNNLSEAESLMRRALSIAESAFDPYHRKVAVSLNNLATLLQATNRLSEAEPLMRRALAIGETVFGPDHDSVANRLNNLAVLLKATKRLSEAEPLIRRALAIDEATFGPNHPNVATDLTNLALLMQATNRLSEAEPLMRRALAIDETALGPDHPNVATHLNNLAQLLKTTNRLSEAEPLMRRALEIFETRLGSDHPNVADLLNNLAQLLQATNRLSEAEPLMRRALAINEARFGPNHPKVANDLNNLAQLLVPTNRLCEAEPLMHRALAIDEAAFGPDHPNFARDLSNLAMLFFASARFVEAEPLILRALVICVRSFSSWDHPQVQNILTGIGAIATALGRSPEEIDRMIRAALDGGSSLEERPDSDEGERDRGLGPV